MKLMHRWSNQNLFRSKSVNLEENITQLLLITSCPSIARMKEKNYQGNRRIPIKHQSQHLSILKWKFHTYFMLLLLIASLVSLLVPILCSWMPKSLLLGAKHVEKAICALQLYVHQKATTHHAHIAVLPLYDIMGL